MKTHFILFVALCQLLCAAPNTTNIDGATSVRFYLRNYAYSLMPSNLPVLSMGLANDINRLVYKNSSGTLYKIMTDASGAVNTPQGRLFYADANGSAGSSDNLTFDGSRLRTNGLFSIIPDGSSYNEGIRISQSSSNGYSAIALGADPASASGWITGQWGIARSPAATGYTFFIDYRGNRMLSVDTSGSASFISTLSSTILNTDSVLTKKIKGTGGTNAAYGLQLLSNTIDGADSLRVVLNGGGEAGTSRGGRITAYGNEHTTAPGVVAIAAGDAAGSRISLTTTSANSYVQANPRFIVGTNTPTHIPFLGVDVQYAPLKLKKIVSNLYDSLGWRYYETGPASVLDFYKQVNGQYGIHMAVAGSGSSPNVANMKNVFFADTSGIVFNDTLVEPGVTKIVGNAKVTRRVASDSIYSTVNVNENITLSSDPIYGYGIKINSNQLRVNNDILTPKLSFGTVSNPGQSFTNGSSSLVIGRQGVSLHDEQVIISHLAADSSLVIASDSVKVRKFISRNIKTDSLTIGNSPLIDTGTFTITWTVGFTTTPTTTVKYQKTGDIVSCRTTSTLSATSNTYQLQGTSDMPASIRPSNSVTPYNVSVTTFVPNSGGSAPLNFRIFNNGDIYVEHADSDKFFSESGTKGFIQNTCFTYLR